jgi:ParB/RepB/Spo0J family partition protein
MAKRKRLNPALLGPGPDTGVAGQGDPAASGAKALLRPGLGGAAPPIARVAGDAAAHAALAEVTEALARARSEGRLVQALPLDAVETDHLVRDRVALDPGELEALIASIRAHGQRTPIEVTELPGGRYGLISGWRRMQALRRLHDETGETRFGSVLALLRRPCDAAAAYVAMVEENEIRQGLSYYERARIVARAVDLGVFATEKEALQRLFAAASRARRSKIGSFLTIHRALDGALRFPAAIPERLGLTLARALEARPEAGAMLAAALKADPPADAAGELARLARFAGRRDPAPAAPDRGRHEPCPGVFLEVKGDAARPVLILSGPGVSASFRARLEAWLADQA